ncbi:DNA-binding NarL/FixJ family response regulator [Salinibacter ruber]|nr:DNA-binding NarL/FixJ family response regulator [Salinibacter ruber]
MPAPIYVRSLTEEEREALEEALRSEEAFTLRRAQIVRLSPRGKRAPEIAEQVG